jgi:hypothetical protein
MKNASDYSPVLTALSNVAFISLLALSMTVPGWASPVTIVNPSFEADGTGFHVCSSVGNAVTGWNCTLNTSVGNDVDNPSATYFTGGVPDGVSAAAIGIFGGHFNDDAFFQILSATVAANTTYTLQMYVGHDNFASFDTPTISLEANGAVLASDSSINPAQNSFALDTIVFNSGPSPAQLLQPLTIRMIGTKPTSSEVWFDKVTLDASPTSPAPEPASMTLLLAGFGMVLIGKFRRGL